MKRRKKSSRRTTVTIRHVAEQSGVSLMTVSRVLNESPNVAEATRVRVQKVIAQLGFVPHRAARSLRARRSWWIALLFQGAARELRGDPSYVVELQAGVIERCVENGYHAAVERLDASTPIAATQLRELVQQLAPDGVVLAPPLSSSEELLALLRALHVPFARVAPRSTDGDEPVVFIDDRAASRQMTEHLLSLGHRRIGFVQGPMQRSYSVRRMAGYRAALRAWKVREEPALIVPGDFTFEGGRMAAAQLLGGGMPPPTAIFASNDESAAGCLADAHQRGLRVPRDLSIAGFDDTYVATMLYPPLTTMSQSIREMGRMATDQVLQLIKGTTPSQAIRIEHRLVERQSTAAPAVAAVAAQEKSAQQVP
ncbi:MAG: LacI family DNA-binding transcriptional regulator [Pseudomonadota bacterium]